MQYIKVKENIENIGVYDTDVDLFEGQYKLKNGVTYNSYIIKDEKVAILDTVDSAKAEEWLANLEEALEGSVPEYLITIHMEPDHAGSIDRLVGRYPEIKVVGNAKTLQMIQQFFDVDIKERFLAVKEGDRLELGAHTLKFLMAPMIHWPEVMVVYEEKSKVLFSADAFGTFEASSDSEEWAEEASRYYFNIVGKYGVQVQSLLKKASALDIDVIAPLHGPLLTESLAYYLEKYNTWSSYEPEQKGTLIVYGSFYGNTKKAAMYLKEKLEEMSEEPVVAFDLVREDMSYALSYAFRFDKLVLAASSYDGGAFPAVEDFLHHLKGKNFQKRKVAYIENGTWAPSATRTLKGFVEGFKNMEECEQAVSIKSALKAEDYTKIEELARELLS